VVERTPGISGQKCTVLAAVGLEGIHAPLVLPGAVNGSIFETDVRDVLGPTLQPGDQLILDNLPAHRVGGVREAIEARGAELIYLPPCSADLNPIEQCWAKIKQALRTAKARTFDAHGLLVLAQARGEMVNSGIRAVSQAFSHAFQLSRAFTHHALEVLS
jgi:transposase